MIKANYITKERRRLDPIWEIIRSGDFEDKPTEITHQLGIEIVPFVFGYYFF